MDRFAGIIDQITNSLKNYGCNTEDSNDVRRVFAYSGDGLVKNLATKLDDKPISEDEMCAIFDYFLSYDYGFSIQGSWLITKTTAINLDQVVRFTCDTVLNFKIYEVKAILTSTKNYGDNNQSWVESEAVRITDVDLPYAVSKKVYERLLESLRSNDK